MKSPVSFVGFPFFLLLLSRFSLCLWLLAFLLWCHVQIVTVLFFGFLHVRLLLTFPVLLKWLLLPVVCWIGMMSEHHCLLLNLKGNSFSLSPFSMMLKFLLVDGVYQNEKVPFYFYCFWVFIMKRWILSDELCVSVDMIM